MKSENNKKSKRIHTRRISNQNSRSKTNHQQMGKGCFPNKKILRNSPCLPACKQKNIATRLRDTT